jgi:hypothetical protein
MPRPPSGSIVERVGQGGVIFALRFRAYGKRRYVTTAASTRKEAEEELEFTLAAVKVGVWKEPQVAPPAEEPAGAQVFHDLADEWLDRRRHEVEARTVENWWWALELRLLPAFASLMPSAITPAEIERFKSYKLRERERLLAELEVCEKLDPKKRGPRPARPLGNEAINRTLKVLAMVLDDAVEFGQIDSNPARGRKRRLKSDRPRRTWLEVDELQALLSVGWRPPCPARDDGARGPPGLGGVRAEVAGRRPGSRGASRG